MRRLLRESQSQLGGQQARMESSFKVHSIFSLLRADRHNLRAESSQGSSGFSIFISRAEDHQMEVMNLCSPAEITVVVGRSAGSEREWDLMLDNQGSHRNAVLLSSLTLSIPVVVQNSQPLSVKQPAAGLFSASLELQMSPCSS